MVTYATGGQWSSIGGGTILPDNTNLNANYYPTSTEISAGSAKLILNTTGNNNCKSQSDSVIFTFQKAPSIFAGPDATICADLKRTSVTATVTNSVDYAWSTLGSGTFNPGNTTLSTNYAPSANDISAQKVGLVISTVNDGVCAPATDTLYININPLPVISVGNDIVLCTDAGGVQLSAVFANATGVKWNSSGDGSFSANDSTVSPFYFIGQEDQILDNIAITATTTGNGSCKSRSDELTITFKPTQIINAGPDIAACIGAGPIQLNGSVSNTTGGTWISSGSGTFSPNATTLNATYTPSVNDENSGQVNLTLIGDASTVCQSNSDVFVIKFSALPVINAGKDSIYCTNSLPIQLLASGASGSWSGGAGVFSPNASALKGTYQPTAAEIVAGTITLTISTNPGLCPVTSDDVTFTIKQGPSVDAGIDTTICVNTTGFKLYGKNNGNSSGIVWSTASGTGTFSPSATDPNASFIPSVSQISNGKANITLTSTGNNGCPVSSDKILVYITPAPVINAGFDITSCKDVSTIALKGSKQPSSTNVVWSTSSTLGSFVDATDVNTTFTPNTADITGGFVNLYLTAPGITLCKAITDTMKITFSPIPAIFAGNDSTLCANLANKLPLNGKVNFASGGVWTTGGTGTFSPNANSLKAIYRPGTGEINSGQISLTFTTTGNGACQPQSDPIVFTLQKPDTVNAGSDTTVCADRNALALIGKSTTPNIKWTGSGTGTFNPNNSLNTIYTLGSSDIKNGGITVILTSTNINACAPAVDFTTLIFNPAPVAIVNAGQDQIACFSETQLQMNGFIANAKGGKWTTSGDGTFTPSDTILDAMYVLGANDKVNSTVNIKLSSTGNGICGSVSDVMKLTLQAIPVIKVSAKNIPACADADSIIISAKVTTATSGLWKTTGNGIFAPKADSLTTHYFPTVTDISSGQIWLIVQSVNNGACPSVSDTASVTFGPGPTIDAGIDMHVCRNAATIALQATTTIATGGQWTSSGAGTFSPNALAANYNVAVADTSSNILVMKVTSIGQGSCKPVSDNVTYTFDPVPVVSAGADVNVCESVKSVSLHGTAKFTTDYSWVSTGTGTFVPDNKSLNAIYQPSAADVKSSSISISLISNLVNTCTPIADNMTITFIKRPVLTISTAPACYTFKGMNVTGTVTNATGANWYSTGSGNFSPDNSKLISQYVFGSKDLSKNITLYLVSNAGICPSDTASAAVFVNPAPKTNAGADKNICPDNKTTITANTLTNVQYKWTEIGGAVVSTQSFATVTLAATKSYQLQITDANKCMGYDTVKVNVVLPIKFNMAASTCLDPYTAINSKPAKHSANGTFQWYKDGNILQGQIDTTILVNSAGAYKIVYNLDQCASDSTIQVHALPTMVNSGKVVCAGAKASVKTSKLPTGSSYSWKTPLPNVNSNMNTVASAQLGTTFYFVTGTDLNSCRKTDSIRVIGLTKPVIVLNDTSFCSSAPFDLNAKPKNNSAYKGLSVKYAWFKDHIDQHTDSNLYLVKQKGLYKAIVTVEECASSDSAIINVYQSPVGIIPADTIFCPTTKGLDLNAGFGTTDQTSSPGTTYTWKNIDASTVVGTTRVVNIKEGGLYSIEIKNFYKCTTTDTIKIGELCGPHVYIPTAFTPGRSDSGKDQVFLIQGKYFKNFTIVIYNRWGEVMFTSKGTSSSESWNGTYLGQDVESGAYPYEITFDAVDPQYGSQKMAGSITVLR